MSEQPESPLKPIADTANRLSMLVLACGMGAVAVFGVTVAEEIFKAMRRGRSR